MVQASMWTFLRQNDQHPEVHGIELDLDWHLNNHVHEPASSVSCSDKQP